MKIINRYKQGFANFQASYDEQSFLINKARKEELFKNVNGKVLELGPGTGVNFKFLNNKSIEWFGVEPNYAMHNYLFKAADDTSIKASLLECTSENICLPDNSMDVVISTEVLCSVTDMQKSLNEVLRVLKQGGVFLFLEHVVDKQNVIRRTVQKTVPHTPWKCYSNGCNPSRDIASAIKHTGFKKVTCKEYLQEGGGIINLINKPHIYGWAIK